MERRSVGGCVGLIGFLCRRSRLDTLAVRKTPKLADFAPLPELARFLICRTRLNLVHFHEWCPPPAVIAKRRAYPSLEVFLLSSDSAVVCPVPTHPER